MLKEWYGVTIAFIVLGLYMLLEGNYFTGVINLILSIITYIKYKHEEVL